MSVKLEIGQLLGVARSFPDLETFLKAHPILAEIIWGQVIKRNGLYTSHNRMRSGKYAKGRCKQGAQRIKQICKLARALTKDGGTWYYAHSYREIADRFDIKVNTVSKICLAANIRRATMKKAA